MVRASTLPLLALLASGCVEAGSPVAIDLCTSPTEDAAELAVLDSASLWQVVVYILRGDESEDVAFERTFGADRPTDGPLLSLDGALPPLTPLRLMVVGYRVAGTESTIVGLATSQPMEVAGGEDLCLCVAPPESYGDDCYNRFCRYDPVSGCTF